MKNTLFISDTHYVIDGEGCWIWLGSSDKDGYGIKRFNGKQGRAHRASYFSFKGEIPEGMCVCHKCDKPSCINPEHLWLGTISDNSIDMYEKGRGNDNRGSKNGKSVLVEDDVKLIKHLLLSTDMSCKEIAEAFEVSRQAISAIKHKRNWSHVS